MMEGKQLEHRYATVIIGAGPAGLAAAITLQKSGKAPCVIEKATFPRRKTCAGLVTAKTYRLIQELFEDGMTDSLFSHTSSRIRLFKRAELLVSAELERPVHFVSRTHFDNALAERYKALGGVLLEGERRIAVDDDSRTVTLSNGDTIRYDRLLFADGALSLSRKLWDCGKDVFAFGIEAYIPSSLLPTESVDLYFDYLDTGYAWVFPHGDTVCVGAADLRRKNTDYTAIFERFLSDLGVPADVPGRIGAFLPYGKAVAQESLPDHVFLLGDAGGLTDPISGEGLYMALQSGICAARALSDSDPKAAYLSSIGPLTAVVREGLKVQHALYSPLPHRAFIHKVRGNDRVVSYFFENMVEEYRYAYRELPRLFSDYRKSK